MKKPSVSIGLPVYNGANYLRRSIQSILDQDYKDFELIICDNASTDETDNICREIASQDPRVRYYRNDENIGAAKNYNKVFSLANGEFYRWATHDDECYPGLIKRCVEALRESPSSVAMVYPLAESIDETGKSLRAPLDRIECRDPRPHRRLAHLLSALNMVDPIFGLYKTEYLQQTQLIGPVCGADYVLLGEIAMLGEIREVDEILFGLRAHAGRSMNANKSVRARTSWYDPNAAQKRFLLPVWEQMVWALLKSVWRLPLSIIEKAKCSSVVLVVHYWQRFKNAGGRLKQKIRSSIKPIRT